MNNSFFDITLNPENGTITSITNINDKHSMNWCHENGSWGGIHCINIDSEHHSTETDTLPLITFAESEISSCSVYKNDNIRVTVERIFEPNGNFTERYTLKNLRETDLFLEQGELSIALPFNDAYTFADDCMVNRCNTHLWCADNITYVNALKMGESDVNLGLMLTKGSIKSYSLNNCHGNDRGIFLMNCGHIELLPEEEYVIEWQLFWHKGNEDFYLKLKSFPHFIDITADNFTVFYGEEIKFYIKTKLNCNQVNISCNGEKVTAQRTENGYSVNFKPTRLGEHKFEIKIGDFTTYTEFFVAEELNTLIKKRIDFIVEKQQYTRHDSPLNGAFLIYDNKEKYTVFNSVIRDHNACRERTGMALLIIKYLQKNKDEKVLNALNKYINFVLREVVDIATGEVFDGVRKNIKFKRLYNAPWITTLFTEMYFLTKDTVYLDYTYNVLNHYYSIGGFKFYPNGLSMYRTLKAFEDAGFIEEKETVKYMFIAHADNMVSNGLSYPKHECNFEQTIVSPAVTFISEIAYITDEQKYKKSAKKHLSVLSRFNGKQPSFHLDEIPIRYWDDFWFGKGRLYGDTFPHYWSCLTARAYTAYYRFSGDEKYRTAAENCMRNCLCLFNDKGEGSCAYVYPFKSNGIRGQFYDEWANDQDFALYFYLINKEIWEEKDK